MQVPVVRRSVPWRSWAARRCLRMGCVGEWASGQVVDLAGSGGSEELPSARASLTQGQRNNQRTLSRQSGPTHLPRARFTPRAGVPTTGPLALGEGRCGVCGPEGAPRGPALYGTARTLGQMFTKKAQPADAKRVIPPAAGGSSCGPEGGSTRSSYSSHLVRCSHITASSLSPRTARARAHTHTRPPHTLSQLCLSFARRRRVVRAPHGTHRAHTLLLT